MPRLECQHENAPTAKFCAECGIPLVREMPLSSEPAAERRQLTVMFCDLVGSTALSEQLDPEELHTLVQAYQEICTRVVHRFDGYIAQYLGDGLLIYFGYPTAHEDDAARAVRTGLDIVEALREATDLPTPNAHPLQVRIGMHTGQVVVGEVGGIGHREQLALGETPNIAARVQNLAEPNTVVISAASYRLIQGLFECQPRGAQTAKGLSAPIEIFQVLATGRSQSRFEMAMKMGLTPLVGRQEEMALLSDRWQQAKAGLGQIVLLSGEPGIGKSRLVQELKRQVQGDSASPLLVPFGRRIEYRCSPNYQNSVFYPVIELLSRVFQFELDDTPQIKIGKIEHALEGYRLSLPDVVPLFAALLSLALPERYTPLSLSPQKQKEQIQQALIAWLVEEARQRPVLLVWEDLHWADPSTLELVERIIPHVETVSILMILSFRPEFQPPWPPQSYMTTLSLDRLPSAQTEDMVAKVASQKTLPPELVRQLVVKTDGIPLFVEELTKMVVDSSLLRERPDHPDQYELAAPLPPLAIPATLQDSLMARLDQLAPVREIAQLAATVGREFSYTLIQAIAPVDETSLQHSLSFLVQKEILYQKGQPPQARYYFKHALIRDTAYQSLLKSKRQQVHRQIAHVLESRFSETVTAQPEILAHHYTEAGLILQALPYWRQAGLRAGQRSANVEAVHHLTKGLELLQTLEDTPDRAAHELRLCLALGGPLIATSGYAAPDVERVFRRSQELCQQLGGTPQLFPALWGLFGFFLVRAELPTAQQLAAQMLQLAEQTQKPNLLLEGHFVQGQMDFHLGEMTLARDHLHKSVRLYMSQARPTDPSRTVQDTGVAALSYLASTLWLLGYPDQSLARVAEAVDVAQDLKHPLSLVWALNYAAGIHRFRRERHAAARQVEAAVQLATDQGLPFWVVLGKLLRSWALSQPGQEEKQIAQLKHDLSTWQAMGSAVSLSNYLALLAEMHQQAGQAEAGLDVVEAALNEIHRTGERWYEAELYRLKGELTLQFDVQGSKFKIQDSETEAEVCFERAIAIAQRQEAKSWELRATLSLSRLWQTQGKSAAAHTQLTTLYNWFTEGFETPDLQEAKALIQTLSSCCPHAE